VIVLLDFEREFAATSGAGVLFDSGEKEPADAGATMGGQDEEVVDIDERSGGERGKAAEADGETDGFRSVVSEEDGGGRVLPQTGNDVAAGGFGERAAVTHGICGVSAKKLEDGLLMLREREVRLGDGNAGNGHANYRRPSERGAERALRVFMDSTTSQSGYPAVQASPLLRPACPRTETSE